MPYPNYPVSLLQMMYANPYQPGIQGGMQNWINPAMPQPQAPNAQRAPVGPYPGMGTMNMRPNLDQPPQPQDSYAPQTPPQTPQNPQQPTSIYNDPRQRMAMGMYGLNLLGPQRYF